MNLISIKYFFCRNDVKILIFCTATGALLQIVSKRYLESHPDFLKDAAVNKKEPKSPRPRLFSPRGGAFIEITGISLSVLLKVGISFLAEKGLIAGVATGSAIIISKLPASAVSAYLNGGMPQNLSHLEKQKFILVGGEKIYLDQCDRSFEFLFKVLEDTAIPFEEKEKVARSVLTEHLNLDTIAGRTGFILCIVLMIYIFSIRNPASFHILIKNLILAIKQGKISKAVGRAIVRRLQKRGVPLNPELLDIVQS